ncbi:MAG: geranylgeranylglycerol-phosphate geranylgeranyltransferase [Anaerolineae bacterium]|nr:geranylgeranylglycerol-phosphate geranylgeranyltransferase [Anaerolineae bacterium]
MAQLTHDQQSARSTPNFFKDLLAMSHIFNGVGSAAAVMIGAIITSWYHGQPVQIGAMLAAALGTLLISNGGFIVNDIFDVEIDRINRPDRPLAAGRISLTVGWIVYAVSTLVGILLGFATNAQAGLVALVIAIALFLYSAVLKKRFILGHASIGIMGGLLLPFGGIAMGQWIPMLYTFPVTFLAFFAREVLKTVPDVDGDRANGVDNFATRYGADRALRIGQIVMTICLLLLPAFYLVWSLNVIFLLVSLLLIWPLFFGVLWIFSRNDPAKRVHNMLRLSKLFFLLVAVALLIGAL